MQFCFTLFLPVIDQEVEEFFLILVCWRNLTVVSNIIRKLTICHATTTYSYTESWMCKRDIIEIFYSIDSTSFESPRRLFWRSFDMSKFQFVWLINHNDDLTRKLQQVSAILKRSLKFMSIMPYWKQIWIVQSNQMFEVARMVIQSLSFEN